MADIFISYARPDRDPIEKLAQALEGQGYSVWWDRNIGGGAEFSRLIEKELMAAGAVLVAWSEHSLDSHWVRDEADYARKEGKLLPVSLDGVLPPLGFRQIHALDFTNWRGNPDDPVLKQLQDSLAAPSAAPAQAAPVPPSSAEAAASTESTAVTRPGIAVLPLVNMSADEDMEFLADGLSEDMITALSRNRHLQVAARTSTFSYKGKSVDIREVGKALGARYVVEGSVRKMGGRCRVTVQFIEADNGSHVWAKNFDETLEEVMAAPDGLLEKIVGNLFNQLFAAEAERALNAAPETLGAWEYCQRAAIAIGRGAGSLKNFQPIYADLQQAVTLAPDYALAHCLMAWASNAALVSALYEDDQFDFYRDNARFHYNRGRELAQDDLLSLTYLAAAESFAGKHESAHRRLQEILARNPASAEAWYMNGFACSYLGRYQEAREAIDRASSLAPEKGYSHQYEWSRAQIEYLKGDYEVAAAHAEHKIRDEPGYGYANLVAALCADFGGDEAAARDYIARARQFNPQLRPEKLEKVIKGQFDKEKGQREYQTLLKLWREPEAAQPSAAAKQAGEPALKDSGRPGIAVLPFKARAADQEIDFLADGLSEDIITSLSSNRHISVAARASTMGYRDQLADVREIGQSLGVRYVFEGSVRKLGPRVRISIQLTSTDTGSTLWAKNLDETLEGVYDGYDELVERIAGSLFAQLITAEGQRAQSLPENQLGVWEYCMRGAIIAAAGAGSPLIINKTIAELEKAIALAPDYGLAHALLSWTYNCAIINGLFEGEEFSALLENAKKHLRLARSLCQDDLYSQTWIGASENYAGMQQRSIQTLEAVLARNPASAEAWCSICQAYAYLGRYDDARNAIKRAMTIAPEAGISSWQRWYQGMVEHIAGDYEAALPLVTAQAEGFPEYGYGNVLTAVDLVLLGRPEQAPRYIAKAKLHNPQLNPEKLAMMMLAQPDREKGKREMEILNRLWSEESA